MYSRTVPRGVNAIIEDLASFSSELPANAKLIIYAYFHYPYKILYEYMLPNSRYKIQ